MSTQTRVDGTHNLIRLTILAALVALLTLATVQRAEANQSGPAVNDQSELAIAICQGGGGTATVDTVRTPASGLVGVRVRCTGGWADGMDCRIATWGTVCTFNAPQPNVDDSLPPLEGAEQVDMTPDLTPEIVDDSIDPVVVEEVVDESATPEPDATDEPVVNEPEIVEDVIDTDIVEDPIQEEQWTDSVDVVEPIQIEEAPQDLEYYDSSEIIILAP
jgi:hypothetical protein